MVMAYYYNGIFDAEIRATIDAQILIYKTVVLSVIPTMHGTITFVARYLRGKLPKLPRKFWHRQQNIAAVYTI